MKQYVIIGNGVAATGCIEGIREVDSESEIVVISSENRPVYCRPLISYYLEGKTDLERINYRSKDFYSDNGCEVIYGKNAVEVDNENKLVILDDGKKLKYDSLCVATGSSSFTPPFEGMDSVDKRFSFMTLDETLALEKELKPYSRVLIVGAGLIGLKCAEGIAQRAGSITVCDLADRVLSRILDADCAKPMQKRLEDNGIKFMLSDTVEKFNKNTAVMKSGKSVDFDILITAVGVRPNVSLVKNAGGDVGRGIVVDKYSKTSLDGIYAAGDCTECYDISCNQYRTLAILPNAYLQGKCAGLNMAGKESVFDNAIPMNSIGFFGLHAMSAGNYLAFEQGGEMYEEISDEKIKRLFIKDGYLTGFILIGDIDRAGIYTSLIREKTPLSEIDFDAVKKSPSLMPFGNGYRSQKLGGVV